MRLDQGEVVFGHESDLVDDDIVDDATCLDLCAPMINPRNQRSFDRSRYSVEFEGARVGTIPSTNLRTHPSTALPLKHADQFSLDESHLGLEFGFERVNSRVNARDKLAEFFFFFLVSSSFFAASSCKAGVRIVAEPVAMCGVVERVSAVARIGRVELVVVVVVVVVFDFRSWKVSRVRGDKAPVDCLLRA